MSWNAGTRYRHEDKHSQDKDLADEKRNENNTWCQCQLLKGKGTKTILAYSFCRATLLAGLFSCLSILSLADLLITLRTRTSCPLASKTGLGHNSLILLYEFRPCYALAYVAWPLPRLSIGRWINYYRMTQ